MQDEDPSPIKMLAVLGLDGQSLARSDRAAVGQSVAFGNPQVTIYRSPHQAVVRYGLAAGATKVAGLDDDDYDIIVFGRGGTAAEGDLLTSHVALAQQAILVFEVLTFRRCERRVEVIRDLGRGAREVLVVPTPLVLVMSDLAESPVYVSRFRQMQVNWPLNDDPQTEITEGAFDATPPRWQPMRPRTKAGNLAAKTTGDAPSRLLDVFGITASRSGDNGGQHVISADPETCASHLLRYLAHHDLIDNPYEGDGAAATMAGDRSALQSVLPSASYDLARHVAKTDAPYSDVPYSAAPYLLRGPAPLGGCHPGMLRRPRAYSPMKP